jgi:hypothetical protein
VLFLTYPHFVGITIDNTYYNGNNHKICLYIVQSAYTPQGEKMAIVTYNMTELGTGRKFRIVGTAPTAALALSEANAKLAMTVGTVVSNSSSAPLTAGAGTANAGTQYSDAIIVLSKSGSADRAIRFDNVTTGISDGNGKVNVTNTLVADFATNYRDGDGNGGYAASHGYFVS